MHKVHTAPTLHLQVEEPETAQVLPLLKRPGLDKEVMSNYRPISNLTTILKLLERLVLNRIRPHLTQSPSFSCLQSA